MRPALVAGRGWLVAALLLLASGVRGQAQEVDAPRLRSLAPFPRALLRRMSLSIGLGYMPPAGAAFFWDAREPVVADAANAPKSLQGDAPDAAGYRRRAVWQAWTTQGRALAERARQSRHASGPHTPKSPVDAASTTPAATALLREDTRALWKQAFACFDKAVALAPREPLPYALRGYYTGQYAKALSGASARNLLAGLPDYVRAAHLDKHNPYLIALAAWFEYTDYGIRHFKNENYDNFDVWKVMPDAQRQAMRTWRGKVEALTHDADRHTAARAYTGLAWLEYEFHDVPPTQAQAHLRRALALNPRLGEAAQLLMHTFAIEDEWPSLAAFCAEQATRTPSATPDRRARFTLIGAYASEKAGQSERAIAQAEAANGTSEDIASLLLLTALCLKHSDRMDDLERAGKLLDRCDALLNASGIPSLPEDRADAALLRSLYFALGNHLPEARQQITRCLQTDPDNEAAKKVQQALMRLSPMP